MSPITDEQMAFFKDQGYLIVRGLLDPEEVLDPVIEEYGTVLDRLADELYLAGKIESRYEDLPFGERITKVWVKAAWSTSSISISPCPRGISRKTRRSGAVPRCSTS